MWGSISWPPLFSCLLFWCGFDLGHALPPSFVLSLTFRSLSGFAFLGSWCCRSVFLPACLLVLLCLCCAPFCGWLGPVVSVLFFGCCRLPSLPDVASLPPAVGPVWRPGPVCTLVWVSGCISDGLVRPYFILSHGSKGFWPCVGFVSPSPPCCICC